ncbi:hypothetical protein PVAP13_3KG086400 [Panicum virgatum]|uniref:Uncharacterized protein n=1 Tax=Panicum virgatum TaxID=38727 RepID=A0A8T0URV8_PANVG|nr:hypothetical protein PVAP13_3KG086400 [Panicum virgatum]KAG2623887.1 hypothetical protein PVAP13_3KG086400 [Panicum virgatum]KAG2623888.1 hypothetical protein PVAP13_3KG086400 [Panicum virgatum]
MHGEMTRREQVSLSDAVAANRMQCRASLARTRLAAPNPSLSSGSRTRCGCAAARSPCASTALRAEATMPPRLTAGSIVSAKPSGSARRPSWVRAPARPAVQPRAPAPRVTADKARPICWYARFKVKGLSIIHTVCLSIILQILSSTVIYAMGADEQYIDDWKEALKIQPNYTNCLLRCATSYC